MNNVPVTADLEQLLTHCPSIKLVPASTLYNTVSNQLIVDINTAYCRARVALQGAQPLQYHNGNDAILWLSPHASFDGSAAIRGGIPLCLPWFGVNQRDPSQAEHGFARNQEWQLTCASETSSEIALTFNLQHQANAIYPYSFSCDIHWRFSTQLHASFIVHNLSTQTMPFSYALHNYFYVDNKYTAAVSGLNNGDFLDNTDNLARHKQAGNIRFKHEVDRVYESAPPTLSLHTHSNTISISTKNMPTAIIWNPDIRALNSSDIKAAYTEFICVERGAAFGNEIQLASKKSYQATMSIA